VDTLSRHLAAEALLRDSSEKRTATVIKRYFRLTIALAGINALVAGTTMIALWSRPGRSAEAVAGSIAPAAQPKLETVYLDPSPVPTPAPAAPVPAACPQPTPSGGEAAVPAPRPRRHATKNQVAQKQVDDTKTVALDSVAERW
jgi:hypothetical protein